MRTLCLLLLCAAPVSADDLRWTGAMPLPWVTYNDVRDAVDAGREMKIAVGVDAPAGFVVVKDGEACGIAKGLWRCWRTVDGKAVMETVATPEPVRKPVLPYPILPNVQAWLGREPICVGPT